MSTLGQVRADALAHTHVHTTGRGATALWVLIGLLGATVVALGYEVRVLKPRADDLQRRKVLPYVGQLVPIVRVATMAGDSVTIGETRSGRSQVLSFFTSSCAYCTATYPEWVKLAQQLQSDTARRFDVYGVSYSSRDSTVRYVAEKAPPYPIVKIDDVRLRKLFRVKGVPMTLVLDPNGLIAYVHPSVIASAAQRDSLFAAAQLVATVTRKPKPGVGDSVQSVMPPARR